MLIVEVNTSLIKANIRFVKSVCKSRLCAVVKADAYGHGLTAVANAVKDEVYAFAVATLDEAMELVDSGVTKKIYVLGAEAVGVRLPRNVIPTVCNRDEVKALRGKSERVSIKVNTGMNRLGCAPFETAGLYDLVVSDGMAVDGIFTHLYNALDRGAVIEQFESFCTAIAGISSPGIRHFAASSCIYLPDKYHLDMVRTGLAIYGYGHEALKPAMRIKTTVVQITKVKCGEHVGYGNVVAKRDMTVATLRIGYGDGIRRTGRLHFTLNGKKCHSVGNVCMDMCMVDVSAIDCKIGDVAELDIRMLIKEYNIIEYEALTMLNARAKRVYIND